MDALQIIAPLIGVVLGALLTSLNAEISLHRERKRIIGVALADLLEIRHRMIAFDVVVQRLGSDFKIGPEAVTLLRNLLESLVPVDAEFHERYNSAVSLLAGIDPTLAFSLRSKNELPKLLSALRNFANAEGADPGAFEIFESTLRSAVMPSLNEAVIDLALSHSSSTARQVKKLIKRSESIPPEVVFFFEQLKLIRREGENG